MTTALVQLAMDRSLRRYDDDGRLHVELTPISKSNICPYFGREIPYGQSLGLDPSRVYHLFRDPVELAKAAASSNNIQLLDMHIGVSARDPKKQNVVGSTGTDAIFDAPYLKNSLVVWDKSAIDLIESNRKKELSCSYRYRPDMTPGTYAGVRYDGVMRDIGFNHVALVEDGRAGADVLVEDSLPINLHKDYKMPPMLKATSRKALVAKGALSVFLAPKLAHDAQIDFSRVLAGVTDKNWEDSKPLLMSRVKIATNGKLAEDANLDGLDKLLAMFDQTANDEMELEADDEKDEDEEKKKKEADDKKARDKRAKDEEDKDKEKKDAEDKAARDKRAMDEEDKEKDKAEDKRAMDAAIKSSVDAAKKDWQREQRELQVARELVTPIIGAVLAQDSAEAYYDLLFQQEKVDTTGVTPSGYHALAVLTIKAATATKAPVRRVANDSAASKSFLTDHPNVARIRVL